MGREGRKSEANQAQGEGDYSDDDVYYRGAGDTDQGPLSDARTGCLVVSEIQIVRQLTIRRTGNAEDERGQPE